MHIVEIWYLFKIVCIRKCETLTKNTPFHVRKNYKRFWRFDCTYFVKKKSQCRNMQSLLLMFTVLKIFSLQRIRPCLSIQKGEFLLFTTSKVPFLDQHLPATFNFFPFIIDFRKGGYLFGCFFMFATQTFVWGTDFDGSFLFERWCFPCVVPFQFGPIL